MTTPEPPTKLLLVYGNVLTEQQFANAKVIWGFWLTKVIIIVVVLAKDHRCTLGAKAWVVQSNRRATVAQTAKEVNAGSDRKMSEYTVHRSLLYIGLLL